jgi:hypothetical protein
VNESQLRELVRRAVAERITAAGEPVSADAQLTACASHPSHARLAVLPGVEAGGPCLIEPRVACNRCGYCQSYGH